MCQALPQPDIMSECHKRKTRQARAVFVPDGISMDNEAHRGLGRGGVPGGTLERHRPKGNEVRRESPPGKPPVPSFEPFLGRPQQKLLQRDPRGAHEQLSLDLELIGKGCDPRKPPTSSTALDFAIITQFIESKFAQCAE
jgi:hypothetical protein